jgi:hypothetical protein
MTTTWGHMEECAMPFRLNIVFRELQSFLNDRMTFREVSPEELKALVKLREALALVQEVRHELAQLEHRSAA